MSGAPLISEHGLALWTWRGGSQGGSGFLHLCLAPGPRVDLSSLRLLVTCCGMTDVLASPVQGCAAPACLSSSPPKNRATTRGTAQLFPPRWALVAWACCRWQQKLSVSRPAVYMHRVEVRPRFPDVCKLIAENLQKNLFTPQPLSTSTPPHPAGCSYCNKSILFPPLSRY